MKSYFDRHQIPGFPPGAKQALPCDLIFVLCAATASTQCSLFNWSDVPEYHKVAIDHAIFDAGGYQLYDTVGETIVVPFDVENRNLYVMNFGASTDGAMYFVNDGAAPTLYLTADQYLVNVSIPDARWYPLTPGWRSESPVPMGIAPGLEAYSSMGWRSRMYVRGGYWRRPSYVNGGIFVATEGFVVEIDGHKCYDWDAYCDYFNSHQDDLWGLPSRLCMDCYAVRPHPHDFRGCRRTVVRNDLRGKKR